MALITWWTFDGTTKDSSSKLNNLTNYGATEKNIGKIGKCYSFDASKSQYMTAKNEITTNTFTIAFWVKFNGDDASQSIYCARSAYEGILIARVGGYFRFITGGNHWIMNTYEMPIGEWVHYTFVCDSRGKHFYINGEYKYSWANIDTDIPMIIILRKYIIAFL